MKEYYIQERVGKAKYCVSYHDGIQTHKDGSPFYGIAIFKNKKNLKAFTNHLEKDLGIFYRRISI